MPTDRQQPKENSLREDAGAALVELALTLPILLFVLFGMVEFGKAFNYWIDETHLANEAARYASVNRNPGPEGTLQASIQRQADTAELRDGGTSSVPDPAEVKICFETDVPTIGDPVTATVSVRYRWFPALADALGVGETAIRGSSTMRLEAEPTAITEDAGCG